MTSGPQPAARVRSSDDACSAPAMITARLKALAGAIGGSGDVSPSSPASASALRANLRWFDATRLARVTGLDRAGLEATVVARPNARGLSVAGGKGLTLEHAVISGVMEAAELAHAEQPSIPTRFGDIDAAAHWGAVIDVARLPRKLAEPAAAPPLHWVEGLDLLNDRPTMVPFDLVHTCWLHATAPADPPYFASTNGLAAGPDLAHAVLHGLCELIERDGLALFSRLTPRARAARRLDPAVAGGAPLAAALARLDREGFQVAMWDATTDVGAPTVLCALRDAARPCTPPGFGAGAHPVAIVAARRALTEAGQTRLTAMVGVRDDVTPAQFQAAVAARFAWAMEEHGAGAVRPPAPDGPGAGVPPPAAIGALARRLGAVGCGPVVAVDLTKDLGVCVARVLAPGLELCVNGETPLSGDRLDRAAATMA